MAFTDSENLSDLKVFNDEVWFNEDVRFYKNVVVSGTLFYNNAQLSPSSGGGGGGGGGGSLPSGSNGGFSAVTWILST
jgi:uncharacterized membrane protein YgcG